MSLEFHYFSGLLCRDRLFRSSSKLLELDTFKKNKAKALWSVALAYATIHLLGLDYSAVLH